MEKHTETDGPDPHLVKTMRAHQYLYYVEGNPFLTDREYDLFCRINNLDGKGGSDRASDYSQEEIDLAHEISRVPARD